MQDVLKKRWLNPKELEYKYGITTSTQDSYRMGRKIPFSKIGKFIRYDVNKIDEWLEKHEVVGTSAH